MAAARTHTSKPTTHGKGQSGAHKSESAKSATTNPATKTGDTVTSTGHNDGGLIGGIGHFYGTHLIAVPITLIALLIGANVGWTKLRRWGAEKGKAIRPLGAITRDIIRFAAKEDTRVVHKKAPWLTGKRLYGILLLLAVLGWYPGLPGIPAIAPTVVFLIVLWARANKIFKARRGVVNQMFAVAHGECRYPKGSELSPWGYVQITKWTNLTQPGLTYVTIPPAYQSEDMKTREKFERNFNGTVSEENAWTYTWESAKNRVACQPADHLPTFAPYPGPGPKWDEIPVGLKGDGSQAIMPLSVTPHALVCGPTGSGKSVLQQAILNHVLAHDETWRIVAIDMKKVEMAFLRKYPNVLRVATTLEEATDVLRSLREEMMRRYEEMEAAGVNHAKDLPDPPKAIMCMIDESTVLLAAEGIKSDEGKERDALHAECQMIIGELGRLSRASMIHVVMCFQRPDAKFLGGEIKANFDCRIAAGRMDTTPSLMVLDSESANRLPKIKGRGMIRVGGELETFQGFFSEKDWYDKHLAAQSGDQGGSAGPVSGGPGAPAGPATPVSLDKAEPQGKPGKPGKEAKQGKPGRLGGLAAKLAAKAEERSARIDAAQESGVVDEDSSEPMSLAKPAAEKRRRRDRDASPNVLDNGLPPLPVFDEVPEPEVAFDDAIGAPPQFDSAGNIYADAQPGMPSSYASPMPGIPADTPAVPATPVLPAAGQDQGGIPPFQTAGTPQSPLPPQVASQQVPQAQPVMMPTTPTPPVQVTFDWTEPPEVPLPPMTGALPPAQPVTPQPVVPPQQPQPAAPVRPMPTQPVMPPPMPQPAPAQVPVPVPVSVPVPVPVPAQVTEVAPVVTPVEVAVDTDRPVIPRPVTKPVETYKPGEPLPSWLVPGEPGEV